MGIIGRKLCKSFGEPKRQVLFDIDLEIKDGEFVSISGRSGSGKSTLLYILSTLDNPSSGTIEIDGVNTPELDDESLHKFRNEKVGFIFQFHYLLPELTALENILLGPRNLGRDKDLRKRALDLLERFEIATEVNKLPSQMSGGQQQRVAIARALILQPRYLFADEPTGNLDTVSGQRVMEIIKDANLKDKTTVVLVTHEPDYAAMASRNLHLIDGRQE